MPAPTRTAPVAVPAPTSGSPDFNLRPPVEAAPATTGQPGTPAVATGTQAGTQSDTQAGTQLGTRTEQTIDAGGLPGEAGLSATQAVIGAAILLVLAAGIFFVRGAVRTHLIANRASPSAASSAGWALFALLLALCLLVVFGLLGNLWGELAFTAPLLVFILLMLVLFVLLYRAAARGRQAQPRS